MRWIDDALDDYVEPDTVTELADPLFLHLLARHHNFDNANTYEVIRRLSEHPHLDRGTALLLFWRCDPPEGFSEAQAHELANVIDSLRRRLVNDSFESRAISVNLRRDLGFNRLSIERMRRAGVDSSLLEATPGDQFDERAVLRRARQTTGPERHEI